MPASAIHPERKHLQEHALLLTAAELYVVPAHQITDKTLRISDEVRAILSRCHIYMICRRPSLSFDPSTLQLTKIPQGTRATGKIQRRVKGAVEEADFSFRFGHPSSCSVELDQYPHRQIITVGDPTHMYHWPASFIAPNCVSDPRFSDLEVVYVGQAFGDGSRSAFDRLQNHETLQRILADCLHDTPDTEVMVLLINFDDAQVAMHIDGTAKITYDRDVEVARFLNILENPPDLKQITCLAEAGLIRYFRPTYNEKYVDALPSKNQKALNHCFELDFASLIVEWSTEESAVRTFSGAQPPGVRHLAQFDLHDLDKRRSFMTFVDDAGNYIKINSTGPVY